jgi:alcohol dehydrogenase
MAPTDAIVRVTSATICGSDPNAMKGHAPRVARGRILGYEGVGIIERVGDDVSSFSVGDFVLISCLTYCGMCPNCTKGERLGCENGGWLLGNAIDGTHAEYVRVPFADHGLFPLAITVGDNADGPWNDNSAGGFMGGVFHGPDEPADTSSIVLGGSVGMGPLLAVMQYRRTVFHPILYAEGHRRN